MKKFITYYFIILFGNTFAQNYFVFENNKKNKSLFDYNDPHSLVSILLQNKHVFEKIPEIGSSRGIHASDGMFQTKIIGPAIEIENSKSQLIILTKQIENECFEDWYNKLLTRPDSLNVDELNNLKDRLKSIYNNTKEALRPLRWEPQISYFDLRNIDCIIMDSSKIYLARKSSLENKKQIVFSSDIESILNLNFSNYKNEYTISEEAIQLGYFLESNVSKNLSKKLSEFQLQRMAQDTSIYSFNLNENCDYSFLNSEGLVEYVDYTSNIFNYYRRKNLIFSKENKGEDWTFDYLVSSDDDSLESWETHTLYRDSEQETFEDWFNRLIPKGDSYDQKRAEYELLSPVPLEILKTQYEKTEGGTIIKYPSKEDVFWIDYPNPAIYIQCGIVKDSSKNSFKISPNKIVFTEKINEIIGENDKPLQLMSYSVGESALDAKINELLKDELQPFSKKINFEWIKLIQNKTGKRVSLSELKKLIHAYEISSEGIDF
jgi:hypothetical protein